LWKRRAVDGDEGRLSIRALLVDFAGEQFLPGSGLSGDEHGHRGLAGVSDELKGLCDLRAGADDFRVVRAMRPPGSRCRSRRRGLIHSREPLKQRSLQMLAGGVCATAEGVRRTAFAKLAQRKVVDGFELNEDRRQRLPAGENLQRLERLIRILTGEQQRIEIAEGEGARLLDVAFPDEFQRRASGRQRDRQPFAANPDDRSNRIHPSLLLPRRAVRASRMPAFGGSRVRAAPRSRPIGENWPIPPATNGRACRAMGHVGAGA